ncbi:hypothetical protein MPTK1_7g11420 [Marchantia polymorpha subsp. ruderalis]|uniref:Uncharacterized protein n=2 Tax=Marchantia polymorpha TaxID=3197 RepID=A0AAF6BYE8_MARPO|nr:hypothetical protein MARPO_0003s0156 [Marchantia polymorpha]BBN17032.1 hypothetical protein Mp_7g11420 [Marchantia polymorpha subsp. ruderalis]|eukprot:PTQ49269.1 hypothetical protein MARPO_0003s0156 [Marchantia polymorpha]
MAQFKLRSLKLLTFTLTMIRVLEITVAAGNDIKRPALVFIGASQSDVGVNNVLDTYAKANHLPYGRDFVYGDIKGATGRFSNGKILPDFVAQNLGLPFPVAFNSPEAKGPAALFGINTASAGAGWLNGTDSNLGQLIPGTQQVQWVKEWQQGLVSRVGSQKASHIIENALYLINIGDNDLYYYLANAELRKNYTEEQYFQLMIDVAIANIKDLYNSGARKMAFTSVTARGCSPLQITQFQPLNRSQCVPSVQTLVSTYSAEVKAAIQTLGQSLEGSKFYIADVFNITVDLFLHPSKYGLEHQESSIGCCGTGLTEFGPLCNITIHSCSDANEYLFFDAQHYTERAWSIIVDSFFDEMKAFLQL